MHICQSILMFNIHKQSISTTLKSTETVLKRKKIKCKKWQLVHLLSVHSVSCTKCSRSQCEWHACHYGVHYILKCFIRLYNAQDILSFNARIERHWTFQPIKFDWNVVWGPYKFSEVIKYLETEASCSIWRQCSLMTTNTLATGWINLFSKFFHWKYDINI